jgi:Calpain family cysteine protease
MTRRAGPLTPAPPALAPVRARAAASRPPAGGAGVPRYLQAAPTAEHDDESASDSPPGAPPRPANKAPADQRADQPELADQKAHWDKDLGQWTYEGTQYQEVKGAALIGGIEVSDVRQGSIGDCYLLAALASLAATSPATLESAITSVGPGKWQVRLYARQPDGSFKAFNYVVDNLFPTNSAGAMNYAHSPDQGTKQKSMGFSYVDNKYNDPLALPPPGAAMKENFAEVPDPDFHELWPAIIEKAYAMHSPALGMEKKGQRIGGYDDIGQGGGSNVAFEALTGKPATEAAMSDLGGDSLLVAIGAALRAGTPVAAGTPGAGKGAVETLLAGGAVYGDHAYSVMALHGAQIELRNPWGQTYKGSDLAANPALKSKDNSGVLSMSIETFRKNFDSVYFGSATRSKASLAPTWVEFSPKGEWDGATVLAHLTAQTSVTPELAAAIRAGPVATAKLCVALRARVDAIAETEPAQREECMSIRNALNSRINELVHATSRSPLQYGQMQDVAYWCTRFKPTTGQASATATGEATPGDPAKEDRGTFAPQYANGEGKLIASATGVGDSYEDFKRKQGPLQSTSEAATPSQRDKNPLARQVVVELDGDDLLEIYERTGQRAPKDTGELAKWNQTNDKLKAEMPRINTAFRMMKLDTSGAQAHYLANAYMESAMLQFMTETSKAGGDEAFREGGDAKLDASWLEDSKDGLITKGVSTPMKVTGYDPGGSVNKAGTDKKDDWDKSFLGRGPIQVTHDWGYLQTLAVMESRLDELEALPTGAAERADIALLAEALRAIKADPRMAADRRYTHLFSAAARKRRMPTEKNPIGTRLDSQVVNSLQPATAGMGDHSQVPESAMRKGQIFNNAIAVINRKNPSSRG